MKLCERCRKNMSQAEDEASAKYYDKLYEDSFSYALDHWEETAVSESECEFWAHATFRIVNEMFGVANDQIEKLLKERRTYMFPIGWKSGA
jgi:hypothetical protein